MARTIERREVRLQGVPRELINAGRDLVGRGHDIWLAGLGAVATAGEEGTRLFETLVERGGKVEERSRKQVAAVREEIQDRQRELADAVEENVYDPLLGALKRFGVPTRTEVRELSERVDLLARRVDSLLRKLGETRVEHAAFQVVPGEDGEGWQIRREGRERPLGAFATKEEAVDEARSLAGESAPSRLSIYKKDGSIQDTITYPG